MRRPRSRPRLPLRGLLTLTLVGCGAATPVEGWYTGGNVQLLLWGGVIQQVSLSDVLCELPYPENPRLTLCTGVGHPNPDDTVSVRDGAFNGAIEMCALPEGPCDPVGTLTLKGGFDGGTVSGRWSLAYSACPGEHVCVESGHWQGSVHPVPETDVLDAPDAGDVTAPVDPPLVGAEPPPDATPYQVAAQTLINQIRQDVGVDLIGQTSPINAAAQAHADYYVTHLEAYLAGEISAHEESEAYAEGYTGTSFMDRLVYQGVSLGAGAMEVMAFTGSVDGAIWGWMETLYHRIPLIHPNSVLWGFGLAEGAAQCEVGDLVYGATDNPQPARWPLPEAVDVPTGWDGMESPQPPLPAGASYPSGPVITLSYPLATSATFPDVSLTGPAEVTVPCQTLDPDADPMLTSTWAIYALNPLAPGTTYTVRFEGTLSGAAHSESWSFTTASTR